MAYMKDADGRRLDSFPAIAKLEAMGARKYDLRSFLLPGEVLPNDGVLDAQPIIQRAIDALMLLVPTVGPVQLYVPEGRYRLNASINWYGHTGVGLAGAGRFETVLLPWGAFSAIAARIETGYIGPDHNDCVFNDFMVDGANQVADISGNNTKVKGIYIMRMHRARFERVIVQNVGATGFGCDFMVSSWFSDCHAYNCGRLITGIDSTGAGFGVATGIWINESVTFLNCTAIGNRSAGIFVENSPGRLAGLPDKPGGYQPFGVRLIGCEMRKNYSGYFASGSTAELIQGCQIGENIYAGIWVDQNSLTLNGSAFTRIMGNTIWGNGTDNTIASRGGIVVIKCTNGSPTIQGNTIIGNHGPGIRVQGSAAGPHMEIRDNLITMNDQSGILITSGTGPIGLVIDNNTCSNNGQDATATYRDGITIVNCILNRPELTRNRCLDTQTTKTQQGGIAISGAASWTVPRIQGNRVSGNAGTGYANTATIVTSTYVDTTFS